MILGGDIGQETNDRLTPVVRSRRRIFETGQDYLSEGFLLMKPFRNQKRDRPNEQWPLSPGASDGGESVLHLD